MKTGDFTIMGDIGDAFIKITKDGEVQLIFGEDDMSLTREMEWEDHEIYKTAVQFSLMIDSYLRNSRALDDLILNSTTGSIPAELIDKDLLPISLAGVESYDEIQFTPDFDTPEVEEEKIPMGLKKDNVIQFKQRKDNEDK